MGVAGDPGPAGETAYAGKAGALARDHGSGRIGGRREIPSRRPPADADDKEEREGTIGLGRYGTTPPAMRGTASVYCGADDGRGISKRDPWPPEKERRGNGASSSVVTLPVSADSAPNQSSRTGASRSGALASSLSMSRSCMPAFAASAACEWAHGSAGKIVVVVASKRPARTRELIVPWVQAQVT